MQNELRQYPSWGDIIEQRDNLTLLSTWFFYLRKPEERDEVEKINTIREMRRKLQTIKVTR